jgi:hypothetical protein
MNTHTSIFVAIAAMVAIAAGAGLWLIKSVRAAEVVTDRGEYGIGDPLEVKIQNESSKPVCFSSCSPFYLEKREGGVVWQKYSYDDCEENDIIELCLDAAGLKKFQLFLDDAKSGLHRLKIPVCIGCAAGEKFTANADIFSNTFKVE